jgi:hypothetical protein
MSLQFCLFKPTTEKLDPPQKGGTQQLRRLLRRIEQGTDAASESRERRPTFVVRERQHLHQDDT